MRKNAIIVLLSVLTLTLAGISVHQSRRLHRIRDDGRAEVSDTETTGQVDPRNESEPPSGRVVQKESVSEEELKQ